MIEPCLFLRRFQKAFVRAPRREEEKVAAKRQDEDVAALRRDLEDGAVSSEKTIENHTVQISVFLMLFGWFLHVQGLTVNALALQMAGGLKLWAEGC